MVIFTWESRCKLLILLTSLFFQKIFPNVAVFQKQIFHRWGDILQFDYLQTLFNLTLYDLNYFFHQFSRYSKRKALVAHRLIDAEPRRIFPWSLHIFKSYFGQAELIRSLRSKRVIGSTLPLNAAVQTIL